MTEKQCLFCYHWNRMKFWCHLLSLQTKYDYSCKFFKGGTEE